MGDVVTPLQSLPPSSALTLDHVLQEVLQRIMSHNMYENSFLFFAMSNSDLLVSAIRITLSFVMFLAQLIRSMRLKVRISNASRRCCDILLMVYAST